MDGSTRNTMIDSETASEEGRFVSSTKVYKFTLTHLLVHTLHKIFDSLRNELLLHYVLREGEWRVGKRAATVL